MARLAIARAATKDLDLIDIDFMVSPFISDSVYCKVDAKSLHNLVRTTNPFCLLSMTLYPNPVALILAQQTRLVQLSCALAI
jgi:hypothetical protein